MISAGGGKCGIPKADESIDKSHGSDSDKKEGVQISKNFVHIICEWLVMENTFLPNKLISVFSLTYD